jgi:hypothetical protein
MIDVWEIKQGELYVQCIINRSLQKFFNVKEYEKRKMIEAHDFIFKISEGKTYIPKFAKNN